MEEAPARGVFKSGDSIEAKYVIRERIGDGGIGIVYLADQPALQRQVAIKVLRPELAHVPTHLERFHNEALAACHVRHPHCVAVIDCSHLPDGAPYIVMQYVPGRSLGRIIAEEVIAPARALGLMIQILAALRAVHAAQIVHGDVKSDNFIVEDLDGHDHVTMIDFGLARLPGQRPCVAITDGEVLVSGTPEYMAPEVLAGKPATIRSDLYGAGVVLYEMLTGTTPFIAEALAELAAQHQRDDLMPPSRRAPDRAIAAALDAVVRRALAEQPDDRFPDATAFAIALGRVEAATAHANVRDLRARIGAALVRGEVPRIADGYLALAHVLAEHGDRSAAIRELEEGIDILTLSAGEPITNVASPADRLIVALAALHEEAGAPRRARRGAATGIGGMLTRRVPATTAYRRAGGWSARARDRDPAASRPCARSARR